MKSSYFKTLALALAVVAIKTSFTQAQGFVPPPPTPLNFTIDVSPDAVVAQWTPVGDNLMILTMDGAASISGPESAGTLTLQTPVDPNNEHFLTLVSQNWVGTSSPATDYIPRQQSQPATVQALYSFVNADSTGTMVTGYITFNPDGCGQRYVSAFAQPQESYFAQVDLPGTDSYLIYAKGFVTEGAGVTCGPLTVNTVNGAWPQGVRVVATYQNTGNADFSCTLTAQ
jgi:hypothetical protein